MQDHSKAPQPESFDEPALLAQQRGFGRLRFEPSLEPGFLRYMHQRMADRSRLVAFIAAFFMLLFALIDLRYLPPELTRYSVPARLVALILICGTVWYAGRPHKVPARRAFISATFSYICSGLLVGVVIAGTRLTDMRVPVTHDGLYLVLLSGFFLVGLPTRHAVVGSWLIVAGYLIAEQAVGSPRIQIIASGLFLGSFAMIGSFGAYIYEHMMRGAYLNECLLKAARIRAERESQGKTRFLATASHDLRQPLHAMSLFIQHLDERVTDREARHTVRRLADSTHLLQAMLNSLLDISRLSVGMVRPQLRPINLLPWLQSMIDSVEASARERGIRLHLICPRYSAVYSDPLLLERLIRNYVNNALMHSGASEVRIEVTRLGQRTRLAVVDNGCGLSKEEQERIFEEFTQLRNPARTLDKGVGLGLSICRQLLHLLEYPSGVQSSPGQGARFWIEVPPADWTDASRAAVPQSGELLRGRIAIVENDQISREATETLLRHWGCQVTSYSSPEAAFDGIEEAAPDLLLSDYRLEGSMDGLDLIRALRERRSFAGPVVLVTADTSEELLEAARLADVAVVYKPVLPARLRRTLQKLMAELVRS
ncbi:His Kinase A (phospho-acceptor) domain-containing protein [Halopseudomonas xinjiangensis]|uniref:histidine kinase n=1 Tax=Halopseudomonas xinjiangensis TaxID=487184 RepID=A0A1H1THF6_9GAMM|nr:ATP-binding protein [Halopseudomonas xinjiangensis]SDS59640.1 His Kinase A (phospho-acceptor) domain-containing protein [Halopseudomonas xinjiangensis]